MRHWEKTSSSASTGTAPHKEGPELILQTVQDALLLESRDATPGKCRRKSLNGSNHSNSNGSSNHRNSTSSSSSKDNPLRRPTAPSPLQAASIAVPLSEIVVVERWPRRHYKLTITTIHNGMLEFDLKNSNRHDLLLAFLQAHLPDERIQVVAGAATADGLSVQSTCSSKSQMDADYLQERTIRERAAAAQESWPEKLSRRVSKVVHTIQTMSGTICDLTVCCRDGTTVVATSPVTVPVDERDAAPPGTPAIQPVHSWNMPVANGGHLEIFADEEISTQQSASSKQQHQQRPVSPRDASSSSSARLA